LQVIANYLNTEEHLKIKNFVESSDIDWYFNKNTTHHKNSPFQYVHPLYNADVPRNHINILNPILSKIQPLSLIRAKVNCTFKTNEHVDTGSHNDYSNDSLKSAVYFVNNNNGYLKIKDQIIKSKANTICIFDSNILHSGFTCTDEDRRLVINICYVPDIEINN
tara:strand:+ start:668 stop:1159 length:492 start_codon:yes stop_codon:yes gene_type:complete